jgi:aspartate 1-decarboxylase
LLITVLKSKIAYAKITQTELYYEGSITIDEDIMDKVGIRDNEQVHIVNVNNAERAITYAIKGKRGSKIIGLNGPLARKGTIGDDIHILAYGQIDNDIETPIPQLLDLK